jgi:vacuolar-type H+-ATPase subunit H
VKPNRSDNASSGENVQYSEPAHESDVLKHLLEIEEKASKIVQDAEEEANHRVMESDRACREAYNASFKEQADALDTQFTDKREKLEADYESGLNEYRKSLGEGSRDTAAFSALFEQFLGLT